MASPASVRAGMCGRCHRLIAEASTALGALIGTSAKRHEWIVGVAGKVAHTFEPQLVGKQTSERRNLARNGQVRLEERVPL